MLESHGILLLFCAILLNISQLKAQDILFYSKINTKYVLLLYNYYITSKFIFNLIQLIGYFFLVIIEQ